MAVQHGSYDILLVGDSEEGIEGNRGTFLYRPSRGTEEQPLPKRSLDNEGDEGIDVFLREPERQRLGSPEDIERGECSLQRPLRSQTFSKKDAGAWSNIWAGDIEVCGSSAMLKI